MAYLFIWPVVVVGPLALVAYAIQKATGLSKDASRVITVALLLLAGLVAGITSDYPYGDVLPK